MEKECISKNILKETLKTDWFGKQIVFLEKVDSTNDEAKRQAGAGASHGTLVVAEYQTAGKGRRGRSFDSPAGEGIWMSLIIRDDIQPEKASMLTLVMGLAAAKAIENVSDLCPQIKWPNDLILSGKKVCGILTEMSMQGDVVDYIVIGTGVNVYNKAFSEELADVATSIFLEQKKSVQKEVKGHGQSADERSKLLAELGRQFEHYYQIYMQTQDLRELMNEYNACLINRGRQVQVLAPKGSYTGQALGINAEGELIVETENGVRLVSSGEVSVRGVLGYV